MSSGFDCSSADGAVLLFVAFLLLGVSLLFFVDSALCFACKAVNAACCSADMRSEALLASFLDVREADFFL
jgi:hypothetical protein